MQIGTRVNYEVAGTRSLFTKTARNAKKLEPPFKAAILDVDEAWADRKLWQVMHGASSAYTANFYLAAVDRARDADGNNVRVNENRRVYVKLFRRTLLLSALITFATFVLAYPIAHLLATLPLRYSNLLMIFVLLPFMVLPLYSVMRPINPSYVRAARSLGATSWTAFRRIYFPQTIPGIGAGSLLVFILAVGYYITPALVGGSDGQLISNLIAFHMRKSLNWSLAAALTALLLGGVLLLYWLFDRLVGIDKLKLG